MENHEIKKHEIRDALVTAEFARKKMLQPELLALGLTLGQGQPRILRTLFNRGSMTQRELADLCHVDVTTMSRTLDRLEENGFLRRCRDQNSRRSYQIELTPEGRALAAKVVECFEQADEIICRGFSDDELEQLLSLLQRVIKNMTGYSSEAAADTCGLRRTREQ